MLSGEDVYRYLDYNVKIIKYPQLKNFNHIDTLLSPYNKVVILYETEKNKGHWVTLYLHKNILYFFDSYGFKFPNDELDLINEEWKEINDMSPFYLFRLLFQKYEVDQNDIKYQNISPLITTCGYWCIARLYLKNCSNEEFKKIFHGKDQKFVVDLVNYLYLNTY